MELNKIKIPALDPECLKKKAAKLWADLNEDNIEIKVTTSAMGLLLLALGIGAAVSISRCMTKMETNKALRNQKKQLIREIDAEAEKQ